MAKRVTIEFDDDEYADSFAAAWGPASGGRVVANLPANHPAFADLPFEEALAAMKRGESVDTKILAAGALEALLTVKELLVVMNYTSNVDGG